MSSPVSLKVGLLGCGTVGGGVVRLVAQNADQLAARIGAPVEIRRVLVRNAERPRPDRSGLGGALLRAIAQSPLPGL